MSAPDDPSSPDGEADTPEDRKGRLLRLTHGFEFAVVVTLFVAIAVVTVLATVRLGLGIAEAVAEPARLTEINAIQHLFGMIMTVLIALEFGNSIMRHLRENETIIQAGEIILISLMAVVRKIMLVDSNAEPAITLVWLGLAALALAAVYWLMGKSGDRR